MGFSNSRKVFLFCLLLAVYACLVVSAFSDPPQRHRRLLLQDADIEEGEEEELVLPTKKKTTTSSLSVTTGTSSSTSKNKKLLKPISSTKNQTKLIKPISASLKNKTKTNSKAEGDGYSFGKTKVKKLNPTYKALSSADYKKKSTDLLKTSSSPKNKTSKSSTNENAQLATEKLKKKKGVDNEVNTKPNTSTATKDKKKPTTDNENQNQSLKKKNPITTTSNKNQQITKTPSQPSWIYNSDDDDFVSDFKDLPSKFQKTFIPDLKKISSSSKDYFSKANKEITKGFKPYVSNKYAPTAATVISFTFIIIPFFIVSLLFTRIKAFFSLQKLLIFVQIYLSIYFSILCLSSLVTGLEPIRFFYATSLSAYVWLQVLQTLGYVLYLLLLLMYLVLVFSTDSGPRSKLLGLAQACIGLAVGLHYYMTVFHRMVLRQPPKTSWRVHAIYATCYLVLCLAGADRRKKAYLGEGGEEGKKN